MLMRTIKTRCEREQRGGGGGKKKGEAYIPHPKRAASPPALRAAHGTIIARRIRENSSRRLIYMYSLLSLIPPNWLLWMFLFFQAPPPLSFSNHFLLPNPSTSSYLCFTLFPRHPLFSSRFIPPGRWEWPNVCVREGRPRNSLRAIGRFLICGSGSTLTYFIVVETKLEKFGKRLMPTTAGRGQ